MGDVNRPSGTGAWIAYLPDSSAQVLARPRRVALEQRAVSSLANFPPEWQGGRPVAVWLPADRRITPRFGSDEAASPLFASVCTHWWCGRTPPQASARPSGGNGDNLPGFTRLSQRARRPDILRGGPAPVGLNNRRYPQCCVAENGERCGLFAPWRWVRDLRICSA